MTVTVFIDGGHGTTGLEIRERLAGRDDVALIELDEARRRDEATRRDALHAADIAILCLPDGAAREAVALAGDSAVRIIDASTAHRVDPAWVYGFPEMEADQAERIASARRVANPGCYALAFIALVRPLVRAGLLAPGTPLSVNATSGFSGGGKAMIEEFESGAAATGFRNYALGLTHKHLPEMRVHAGLDAAPLFSPSVANVYRGMIVEVPIVRSMLAGAPSAHDLRALIAVHYACRGAVRVLDSDGTEQLETLAIERCAGLDRLEIMIFSSPDGGQLRLCAALDNLGKGAAGSAIQNLNLMVGLDMLSGLRL
ncbi:MAG: N-acetyl-gamma-glutamyl-phosphate reductase [Sphingomonadaceae bacterium]|nr:N-acetyl-gamma-glutamyl-phosphate reductase [Sphingomonadaceae bacterium]